MQEPPLGVDFVNHEDIRPGRHWHWVGGVRGRVALPGSRVDRGDRGLAAVWRHVRAAGLRSQEGARRRGGSHRRDSAPGRERHRAGREGFAKKGIEAFHGRAHFIGPTTIAVGGDELEGRHVLVATGAKPADLDIPGREHLTTSEQFLELDDLPSSIVFVGGGYISFEFAHVAARAGARRARALSASICSSAPA